MGADCNDSGRIHKFVEQQIGVERARFTGDFDLPLQLHVARRSTTAVVIGRIDRNPITNPISGHTP